MIDGDCLALGQRDCVSHNLAIFLDLSDTCHIDIVLESLDKLLEVIHILVELFSELCDLLLESLNVLLESSHAVFQIFSAGNEQSRCRTDE